MPLYAPVAAERRLALAYDDDGDGLTDVFDFVPVGPGSFSLGPFEVTLARTAHPVECYAIRLTAGGRSLVYTGDTGPCERVVELARGADVLLAEAAHPPGQDLPAGPAPHRPGGRRARRGGRGGPAAAHPHPVVGGRDRAAVRRQRGLLRDRARPPGALRLYEMLRDGEPWPGREPEEERDGVRLTSLDQPLGDGLDVTKGDLVDYLDAVADRLVPLLAGRPLSVKRVRPGQAPFMQRNVSKGAPDWVRTVPVWSEGSHREIAQVLCDDRRTLLWLANQRAVEFHVPFFRVGDAEPTGLVLDLDPPEGADFATVVRAARLVQQALEDSGLTGAVKTSGSKGVHVVVPVRGAPFEDVAAATRALAARTERLDPELATTAYIKEDRHGRVFVDSTRSGQSTIVAAYSPRIRPGLPGVRPGRLGRAGRRAARRTSR